MKKPSNQRPKGHWTKGKRRNPDSRERNTVLADLASLLATQYTYGVISPRQAALAAEVSERTLARWLDGVDWPSPLALRRLSAWVRKHRGGAKPEGS